MNQATLHQRLTYFFDFSLIIKGIDGVLEVIAGILLALLTPRRMGWLVHLVTTRELLEDPRDLLANKLLLILSHFTPHAHVVWTFFLLSHGLIKIILAWQLLRGRMWVYPYAIALLLGLMVFQVTQIILHHSPLLTAFTLLDAIIIVLACYEYSKRRRKRTHS